jgi:hypothetical protein
VAIALDEPVQEFNWSVPANGAAVIHALPPDDNPVLALDHDEADAGELQLAQLSNRERQQQPPNPEAQQALALRAAALSDRPADAPLAPSLGSFSERVLQLAVSAD